jgi:acetolactate synthase I/II/III large subunit
MAKKLSGSEFVAEYLIKEGVPYIFGLPGHGVLAFMDAFRKRQNKIKTITCRHEQACTFAADAFCRVSGKPGVAFTTVGPGAMNSITGISTALMDSIPMILFTANCPVYMNEKGAMQEIERNHWADVPEVMRPIVKRTWNITDAKQLADVLPRAFRIATSGRPGPVHIDMPMDVQAQMIDLSVPDPQKYKVSNRILGDVNDIGKAVELLRKANRPLLLCGGGVILSDADAEVTKMAELLGIPVVSTFNGKGCISEDHPLWSHNIGFMGSTIGNHLAKNSDLILAVGCRFSEWTCSSYKPGVTFHIPPTKIIQIDIDPREIAKNYPVEIGIIGDVKTVLKQMIDYIGSDGKSLNYKDSDYYVEQQREKKKWQKIIAKWQNPKAGVLTIPGMLQEIRKVLDHDAIILSDAGHTQDNVWRAFPVYQSRCHISSGGSSTMGYSVPAAIGCKCAAPKRQVVGIIGDGSFLMTCQELSTAVHYDLPIIYIVTNNNGWVCIKDLQENWYGKKAIFSTLFTNAAGKSSNPDYKKLGEAFGVYSQKVTKKTEIKPALKKAFHSGRTSLIEVFVESKAPYSGLPLTGWADYPTPDYIRKNFSE